MLHYSKSNINFDLKKGQGHNIWR